MGILGIPNEILLLIGESLSIKDLARFILTCRRMSSLLTPRLHKLGVQDIGELTALQWSAVRGHVSLIELAVSNGAEINKPMRGQCNYTALHMAVESGNCDPTIIRTLVKHGARTDVKDSELRTPLCLAACFKNVQAIGVLLELRAGMECAGELDTPAHVTAIWGDIDCMRALVAAGFDFDARDCHGQTILHNGLFGGEKLMEYLLGQEGGRAMVNAGDYDGWTPLHHAVCYLEGKARGMVELLLKYGADIQARDRFGNTPGHLAAEKGDTGSMAAFIDAGFDFGARGSLGQTILHRAVFGRRQMLKYLLQIEGGKMIINAQSDNGSTPLHLAVGVSGGARSVKLLLKYGADMEVQDCDGNTAPNLAALQGQTGCVRAFKGAGVNLKF